MDNKQETPDETKRIPIAPLLWPWIRQIFGWICVGFGLILAPLPIPLGLPLIAVGVILIGRRNRVLRWIRVAIRLKLREWAAQDIPLVSQAARKIMIVKKRFLRTWRERKERLEKKTNANQEQEADKNSLLSANSEE